MDYDYAINDYMGNDYSKREHIESDTAKGEYKTLLPNGDVEIVTYDSGPYGHFANVRTIKASKAPSAPAYTTAAPAYTTAAPAVYPASAPEPAYNDVVI